MIRLLLMMCFFVAAVSGYAQSFEVGSFQETYRALIGETVKVPVRFKNNTDRTVTLVVRKVSNQIGTTQRNYFCVDNNCLDHKTDDLTVRVEPFQVLTSVQVALEAGLALGTSSIKYLAFNKSNPSESFEFDLHFTVEEKAEKEHIYASSLIILHDVYPNPATDHAFVDYTILDPSIKAKIMIHNILGNAIEEYPLPASENKVKIRADALNSGIYFYTLYQDNEGLITNKLIVRK